MDTKMLSNPSLKNIDLNVRDNYGWTSFMNACNFGQKRVVKSSQITNPKNVLKSFMYLVETTLGYYFYGLSNVSGLLIVPRTDGRTDSRHSSIRRELCASVSRWPSPWKLSFSRHNFGHKKGRNSQPSQLIGPPKKRMIFGVATLHA